MIGTKNVNGQVGVVLATIESALRDIDTAPCCLTVKPDLYNKVTSLMQPSLVTP